MSEASLTELPWYLAKQPAQIATREITVIGAGIAGCTTAVALQRRGFKVTVVDRHPQAGSEASGNSQGIVYPKLSPRDDLLPQVNLAAIQFCKDYYQPFWDRGLGAQCGILVVPESPKKAADFALISQRFADRPEIVQSVDHQQLCELAGIPLNAVTALYFPQLGWLPPALVCQQLLQINNIPLLQADIHRLERDQTTHSWELLDARGQSILKTESVVIASAFDCKNFAQSEHLPLRKIRGQITQLPSTVESRPLKTVICGEGYFTPAVDGLHSCGATYNKDIFSTEVREQDHLTNIAQISATDPGLATALGEPAIDTLRGRANFRCTTPDYLPIVGALPNVPEMLEDYAILRKDAKTVLPTRGSYLPNLYVNCGMGSRGLSYAPLTAEILATQIAEEASPVNLELLKAMHPARFLIRDLKRKRI
ncbi:MAG: FAD-dependent 5-carboxymethylaminomethyl-2-thiouridine(34) oxidoreductase MnmC [Porticoccaceae bacterium]|nr:FAD-dependent 5-carboxymethylaminomethyl-2-thiouridine(34) oxidoreductase MnmC [Porticoccaceae bacterium]